VRTTAFICLFGTLTTFLAISYSFPLIVFLGIMVVSAFSLALYVYRAKKEKQAGLTTSTAMLLTYFIGSMTAMDLYREAIALSVFIFLLLFSKKRLVGRIRHLTEDEIFNAVEFAIIAFVIYPFLPDYFLLGVNVKQVWSVVLLVSVVSFVGFLAVRHFGDSRGILLSSVFGSIFNSSAVIVSNIQNYRKNRNFVNLFVLSSLLAFCVLAARNAIATAFFSGTDPANFAGIVIASIAFFLASYAILRKAPKREFRRSFSSPFAIKPALYFGFLFFIILAFSKAAVSYFGEGAIVPISFFGGMGSGYAVAATASLLFVQGSIDNSLLLSSTIAATVGAMLADTSAICAFRQFGFAKKLAGFAAAFALLLVLAATL
jgi:uncharacterized membrane protein (DUF4010 family)